MGKLALWNTPPGSPPTPVHDTRVSPAEMAAMLPRYGADLGSETAVEAAQLITQLMLKLGVQAYCVWLANFTPVEWLTSTPYEQIRDTLAAKLSEIQ